MLKYSVIVAALFLTGCITETTSVNANQSSVFMRDDCDHDHEHDDDCDWWDHDCDHECEDDHCETDGDADTDTDSDTDVDSDVDTDTTGSTGMTGTTGDTSLPVETGDTSTDTGFVADSAEDTGQQFSQPEVWVQNGCNSSSIIPSIHLIMITITFLALFAIMNKRA